MMEDKISFNAKITPDDNLNLLKLRNEFKLKSNKEVIEFLYNFYVKHEQEKSMIDLIRTINSNISIIEKNENYTMELLKQFYGEVAGTNGRTDDYRSDPKVINFDKNIYYKKVEDKFMK